LAITQFLWVAMSQLNVHLSWLVGSKISRFWLTRGLSSCVAVRPKQGADLRLNISHLLHGIHIYISHVSYKCVIHIKCPQTHKCIKVTASKKVIYKALAIIQGRPTIVGRTYYMFCLRAFLSVQYNSWHCTDIKQDNVQANSESEVCRMSYVSSVWSIWLPIPSFLYYYPLS